MKNPKLVVGHLMDDQLFVKSVKISKSLDWLKWLEAEELVEFFEGLLELITQISEKKEDSEMLGTLLHYWREIALEAKDYEENDEENYQSFFESLADSIGTVLVNSGGDILANIAEAQQELDSPWIDIIEVQPEQESTPHKTYTEPVHVIDVTEQQRDHYLAQHIFGLPFSPRIHKCLERENVEIVRDLVTKTERELLAYKDFGRTSLHEVKERLANMGLSLEMDLDDEDYEEDEDSDGENTE